MLNIFSYWSILNGLENNILFYKWLIFYMNLSGTFYLFINLLPLQINNKKKVINLNKHFSLVLTLLCL